MTTLLEINALTVELATVRVGCKPTSGYTRELLSAVPELPGTRRA
jgi:hypothetical protein